MKKYIIPVANTQMLAKNIKFKDHHPIASEIYRLCDVPAYTDASDELVLVAIGAEDAANNTKENLDLRMGLITNQTVPRTVKPIHEHPKSRVIGQFHYTKYYRNLLTAFVNEDMESLSEAVTVDVVYWSVAHVNCTDNVKVLRDKKTTLYTYISGREDNVGVGDMVVVSNVNGLSLGVVLGEVTEDKATEIAEKYNVQRWREIAARLNVTDQYAHYVNPLIDPS